MPNGELVRDYKDLYEYISFEGFHFADYYDGEREILQPRLEALGYTDIKWSMGERDSFGPLTRVCRAVSVENKVTWFIYG